MNRSIVAFFAAAMAFAGTPAVLRAQDAVPPAEQPTPSEFTVVLDTGEVLRGTYKASTPADVTMEHPVLGELVISRDRITSMSPSITAPSPAQPEAGEPAAEEEPAAGDAGGAEPPAEDEPITLKQKWYQGWTGSVDLGLFGSSGNTENLSVRGAVGAERKNELTETTLNFAYYYAKDAVDTTENRIRFDARNDWLVPDSRWRWFAQATYEFDEFQNWDHRVSIFAGPGYEFIRNERTELIGRAGLGLTKEFGGEDNRIMPEGLLGLDFSHIFDDRNKVIATVEVFPSLADLGEYRARAAAEWQIVLNHDNGMNLKLGVEDRYDSSPGDDREKNDITYYVTLGFKF